MKRLVSKVSPTPWMRAVCLIGAVTSAWLGLAAPSLAAGGGGHVEVPEAVKVDTAQGEKYYGQQCASCHGADGNSASPAYPKLAGQHPEYLVKQLHEFKSGKRANAIMKPYATALNEQQMRNIAAWLHQQPAKPGFAGDKAVLALGEKIYRGGLMEKGVPACAGCHSPSGAGIPSQYPRLAGQHADYTNAQLIAFRDSKRMNNSVMNQIAYKLNATEIRAVSEYVAGLRKK